MHVWEFSVRTEELDLERRKAPEYLQLFLAGKTPLVLINESRARQPPQPCSAGGVSQVMELSRSLPVLPLRLRFSLSKQD